MPVLSGCDLGLAESAGQPTCCQCQHQACQTSPVKHGHLVLGNQPPAPLPHEATIPPRPVAINPQRFRLWSRWYHLGKRRSLQCNSDQRDVSAILRIWAAMFSGERMKSIQPVSIALSGMSGTPAVSGFWAMVMPPISRMPQRAAAPSPS